MPEKMIDRIKASVLPQWWLCFVSAIIMGFAAHLYKIANWLPNWDSLVFRYDAQNMLAMGRWLLGPVCAPGSYYDLPWLAGVTAIVAHAFGAVCICRVFNVRRKTVAIIIGAIVSTFPTVTSVMMYNYVADGYGIAFALACLAAVYLVRSKPRLILAALLITASVGIYQAYVTVTITLVLLFFIDRLLHGEMHGKEVCIKGVKILATGVCGMALYYGILVLLLNLTGTELIEYQGIGGALVFENASLWHSIEHIKNIFIAYFFDFSHGIDVFHVLNILIFAGIMVLCIISTVKCRVSIGHCALIGVLVLLLPIGATALAIINCHIDYHNLMKMAYCLFYVYFAVLYERTVVKKEFLRHIKAWGILLVCGLLVYNQMVIANISYHKVQLAYEKSYGTLIRIADRIEQTPGAAHCDKILVLGTLPGSEKYSVNLPPDITGATDGYILRYDDEVVGQSVLCSALNDYCGTDYTFVAGEEKRDFLEKERVRKMKHWPDKNSVTVVDGVIVISLGELNE